MADWTNKVRDFIYTRYAVCGMRVCGYVGMRYAVMRLCGYAVMRECGYVGMRVCGYAGMRVCGYAVCGMQICEGALKFPVILLHSCSHKQ